MTTGALGRYEPGRGGVDIVHPADDPDSENYALAATGNLSDLTGSPTRDPNGDRSTNASTSSRV